MEGGKKSSSAFPSELFGTKGPAPGASSSELFESIFPTPPKVAPKESLPSSETEKKRDPGNHSWSGKNGVSDYNPGRGEGYSRSTWEIKDQSSYFTEEKAQPFHYSSSIFYGGQDVYSPPQSAQDTVFSTFNKDGGEDDSAGASRGNWWQGIYTSFLLILITKRFLVLRSFPFFQDLFITDGLLAP